MCVLCKKVDSYKEILSGYYTDEEMNEMAVKMGYQGPPNATGVRMTVAIMAVIDLALENGLALSDIAEGVNLAVTRHLVQQLTQTKHHVEGD